MQPSPARRTRVLDAIYRALLRSDAKSLNQLRFAAYSHFEGSDFPSATTFNQWVLAQPLVFQRTTHGRISVALRTFAPADETNAYIIPLIGDLPLRLHHDDKAIRRALWLDDRPNALYDSLIWASRSGHFTISNNSYGQSWTLTRTVRMTA
jgi:hypothetical protein